MPASRLQLDRRTELFVTSRNQLQANQQRITLSISGLARCLFHVASTGLARRHLLIFQRREY